MPWKETADKGHTGGFSCANCSPRVKRLCLGPASSPALGDASGMTPGHKILGKEDFVEKRKKQLVLKLSSEKRNLGKLPLGEESSEAELYLSGR